MFRKSTLSLCALVALNASSFLPSAGAASAEEAQVPAPATTASPAAPAAADPKGQPMLQTVIDELEQGKSDLAQIEPTLKVNLMQRQGLIPSLSARLQSLGTVQTVSFAGVQNGYEIYDVRFANGASTWGVALATDGKINHISWRFQ